MRYNADAMLAQEGTYIVTEQKYYSVNSYHQPSPKQAVILAGGRGTRLMERTVDIPKPMITIGDKTLLEHIIDIYSYQGIHEFLIPVGYKKEVIFEYFLRRFDGVRFQNDSGVTGQIGRDIISIIDTGLDTQTGGRIRRLRAWINGPFFWTYGDAIGDINLYNLQKTSLEKDTIVTITAVRPIPRFGGLLFYSNDDNLVYQFGEKIEYLRDWINGGFGIMTPKIFDWLDGDDCNMEKSVFPILARKTELSAMKHNGIWKCVDTLRDLNELEQLYLERGAVWLKN